MVSGARGNEYGSICLYCLDEFKKPKCNNLIYFSPLTCPKTLFLKPVLMKVFHNGHTVNVFKHLTVSVHRLWCIAHISALRRLSSCKTSQSFTTSMLLFWGLGQIVFISGGRGGDWGYRVIDGCCYKRDSLQNQGGRREDSPLSLPPPPQWFFLFNFLRTIPT